MALPLKVFLDLEDTIIRSWGEPDLMNAQKIRVWLDKHDVSELHIFSFAIWDHHDQVHFEKTMKMPLERVCGRDILSWMSVHEMQRASTDFTRLRWLDQRDFMQIRGKHGAFFDVCKATQKDAHCVLLDDAVPRETLLCHSLGLQLDLVPIKEGEALLRVDLFE